MLYVYTFVYASDTHIMYLCIYIHVYYIRVDVLYTYHIHVITYTCTHMYVCTQIHDDLTTKDPMQLSIFGEFICDRTCEVVLSYS